MDKEKARKILQEQLRTYRAKPYRVLKSLIGQVDAYEIPGPDGAAYQIEVQVIWDDKAGGNIRVFGAIDDGGLSVFAPLSDDFIMTPGGTFLGE